MSRRVCLQCRRRLPVWRCDDVYLGDRLMPLHKGGCPPKEES